MGKSAHDTDKHAVKVGTVELRRYYNHAISRDPRIITQLLFLVLTRQKNAGRAPSRFAPLFTAYCRLALDTGRFVYRLRGQDGIRNMLVHLYTAGNRPRSSSAHKQSIGDQFSHVIVGWVSAEPTHKGVCISSMRGTENHSCFHACRQVPPAAFWVMSGGGHVQPSSKSIAISLPHGHRMASHGPARQPRRQRSNSRMLRIDGVKRALSRKILHAARCMSCASH